MLTGSFEGKSGFKLRDKINRTLGTSDSGDNESSDMNYSALVPVCYSG
jgi:hypothetical protein